MDMRGLAHFIRDVREATTDIRKEKERVDQELTKIRAIFSNSVNMSTYDRKKYVCKLMFISMLGYPVTFGHMEGLELMAGQTSSEKLIGYLSVAVFLNENSELLTLTRHTVYRDLMSGSDLERGLALSLVASTAGKDFAEMMHNEVQSIILNDAVDIHIRKKALLTLLRIYQKYPEVVNLSVIVPKAVDSILSGEDGVSMCAVKFLSGCMRKHNLHLFRGLTPRLIDALSSIVIEKKTEPGYVYYGVPAPWLQCSLLQLLHRLPVPEEPQWVERVVLILRKILKATNKVLKDCQTQLKQKGIRNRVSVMTAVLLEVFSLSIAWGVTAKLLWECLCVINSFILEKMDANFRYIGLELLHRLRHVNIVEFSYQTYCKQYEPQIIVGLHDVDGSIRRRALDVFVAMVDVSNSSDIIKTLLMHLPLAKDPDFKTYLLTCIAFLGGKYIDDPDAYTDVMLTIVAQAGSMCPPGIVHRLIRVIINNPSVQKHAASTLFNALQNKHSYEPMVQVAAFVLGECGYQIALNHESTPLKQYAVLDSQLEFSSPATQAMILTALFKFYNVYDDAVVRERIVKTLCAYKNSTESELQQRATEYMSLIETGNRSLMERLLQPLPYFPTPDSSTFKEIQNEEEAWTLQHVLPTKAQSANDDLEVHKKAEISEEEVKQSYLDSSTAISLKPNVSVQGTTPASPVTNELIEVSELQDIERLEQARLDHCNRFISLLQGESGVLFEDSFVELRCGAHYHLADCRLAIEIRDKTGKGLKQVTVEILNTEIGLLLQSRSSGVTSLPPNGVTTIDFAARSTAPFRSLPLIQLRYHTIAEDENDTKVGVEALYLPIHTARFISSYEVSQGSDHFQLLDRIKRTCSALSYTLSTIHHTSKEFVIQALSKIGFHVESTGDDSCIAVGAHITKPTEKTVFMYLACEVYANGEIIQARVYAPSPIIQEVVLDMLELMLQDPNQTNDTQ